jgi:SAM-dependent methyltransferase
LSTDTDWDKWGEIDPYFGVLSSDEYRADNLNEELRAKFFHSGDVYIRRTLDIPLAGLSREVVGIDVSDHMLAEAASNCEKRNVENVALVKSDDRLTQLDGSFNLIHSCLVLQHIPAKRGMQLIDALVRHLEPGGVVVIQFYYRCDAPKLVRALVKLRYRLPIANTARNLIRGRPLQEPAMQLHTYDLEAILCLLKAAGVASIYLHPFTHDEFQSVTLYGQKSDRHSVSESTTTT